MKNLVKSCSKSRISRMIAVVMLLSFVRVGSAWAGYGTDVAEKIARYAAIMEDVQEMTITKINSALLTKSSNSMSYTAKLYSGNKYVVYAFGDARISDTDLTVYRKSSSGEWLQVKKDADTSNLAIVSFDCNTTGEYKFEIKAYEFEEGYSQGYYGLIIGFDN